MVIFIYNKCTLKKYKFKILSLTNIRFKDIVTNPGIRGLQFGSNGPVNFGSRNLRARCLFSHDEGVKYVEKLAANC